MIRASRRKFHYIYKITRVDNGKYYIGMHSTDNLEDGYFGSGKLITASVKKHGKEKHIKEILEYCESREVLKEREKELVTHELLEDEECMNLRLGGEGGGGWAHLIKDERYYAIRSQNAKNSTKKLTPEQLSKRQTKANHTRVRNGLLPFGGKGKDSFLGKAHTADTKQKMRDAHSGYKYQAGTKNSQFGTVWIYHPDLKENRKLAKSETIPEGWFRGRKIKFT